MQQRIRVLIADDYARSRKGLRALLTTWSEVEVVGEAVDGREAICRVAECQPDVVLMDARMPVMNGLEATRLIKQNWPTIRIVLLTLYAAYRAGALAAGADAFLIKGCPDEDLLAAILKPDKPDRKGATPEAGLHTHRTKYSSRSQTEFGNEVGFHRENMSETFLPENRIDDLIKVKKLIR